MKLQILLPDTMIQRIDDWRRMQPRLPNRSESVRQLLDIILDLLLKTPAKK